MYLCGAADDGCVFSASMIWILGEYCDRIDGVDEQLTPFVENFHDENVQVSAIGCGGVE